MEPNAHTMERLTTSIAREARQSALVNVVLPCVALGCCLPGALPSACPSPCHDPRAGMERRARAPREGSAYWQVEALRATKCDPLDARRRGTHRYDEGSGEELVTRAHRCTRRYLLALSSRQCIQAAHPLGAYGWAVASGSAVLVLVGRRSSGRPASRAPRQRAGRWSGH